MLKFGILQNKCCTNLFNLFAFSILPDHIHLLIKLEENNYDFSKIIKSIKGNFTVNYKKANQLSGQTTLWQKRFWDHIIRDEQDLKNHLDYIHWNPVKHGYVSKLENWKYLSFLK